MLQKIADFYEEEVDLAVAGLTALDRTRDDGVPRRRRRRLDHRDVPADLQAGRKHQLSTDRDRTETIPVPIVARGAPTPGDSLVQTPAQPPSDVGRRVVRLLLLRTLVITRRARLVAVVARPRRGACARRGVAAVLDHRRDLRLDDRVRRAAAPRTVTAQGRAADARDRPARDRRCSSTSPAAPRARTRSCSRCRSYRPARCSYRRGAAVVTAASAAAYIAIALLAWSRAIDLPLSAQVHPWEQSGLELGRTIAVNLAALIGVGALALIFGDQLQRGSEALATTRRAAADLLDAAPGHRALAELGADHDDARRHRADLQPGGGRHLAATGERTRESIDRRRVARLVEPARRRRVRAAPRRPRGRGEGPTPHDRRHGVAAARCPRRT